MSSEISDNLFLWSGLLSKRALIVTVKVAAVGHTQKITITLIETDPVSNPTIRSMPTFNAAIDYVRDHTIPRLPPRRDVVAGRRPLTDHHAVARRLWRLWSHPEPDGRLEGDGGIGGHQVRVVQEVRPNGLPCLSIVVVAVHMIHNKLTM